MLQYLIILLDESSVAYCHADNHVRTHKLIPLDVLRDGIRFAMMENLMIQFVYPDYELPEEYLTLIDSIDHISIKPALEGADVWVTKQPFEGDVKVPVVLRLSKEELFANKDAIADMIGRTPRLNIIITDIETFNDDDFIAYKLLLESLAQRVRELAEQGSMPWINLLTDRMALTKMNNCGAGVTSITLAPDGRFYICPAFYYEGNGNAGSFVEGIDIANRQLFAIEYAPICRNCDAYQCRRCVWLNDKLTHEVNTPGREQCVLAHLERNAARTLLSEIRQTQPSFLAGQDIPAIDYLDPFEKRLEWN